MTTLLSSLGVEDIIMLCSLFFAVIFGFSHGITTAKGF